VEAVDAKARGRIGREAEWDGDQEGQGDHDAPSHRIPVSARARRDLRPRLEFLERAA
jgi:hypothetical protein